MPDPPRRSGLGVAMRRLAVDVGPLRRSRPFRLLFLGQLVSMLGRQVTVVAIPFQLFALTGSTLALGALGLVQVVPLIAMSLAGGVVADRVDRRRLLLLTNILLAACSTALAVAALTGRTTAPLLFVVAGLIAAFSAIDQPARSATTPNLVERRDLPAAVALNIGLFQVSLVAGPVLGGVLVGSFGLGTAYLVDVMTFAAAVAAVAALPAQPPRGAVREAPLRALAGGLGYLRRRRDILGSFAADLVAMVFGMPRALFPVLAATVYHTGAQGLGLLYAALGAGAVVAIVVGGGVGRVERLGRVIVVSVVAWGAAVAVMGVAGTFWVALLALVVAGAADSISAICRSTQMQASVPDHLRGRVASVYTMVVMGGPYVGDLEAGAVGAAFGPTASVVSGGLLCIGGIVALAVVVPDLWRARLPGAEAGSGPPAPLAEAPGVEGAG